MTHQLFLTVKDHSVSKESFDLYRDAALDLVYTHPQPVTGDLARYYESDNYISHTDGKRSLFEKLYQAVKSIALKNKVSLSINYNPQKELYSISEQEPEIS